MHGVFRIDRCVWVPVFGSAETGMTLGERRENICGTNTEAMSYYVYILASGQHGTLYVGVTNSLARRIAQHKAKQIAGFTKRHDVDRLVWWRAYGEVTEAIGFEKRLKRWRREWKVNLIESENPKWGDLYPAMMAP